MRTVHRTILGRTLGRLLVPAAAVLGLACQGSTLPDAPELSAPDQPEAPSPAEPDGAEPAAVLTGDRPWADGYVWANDPTSASYTPLASFAYNWAGGPIRITRPAGTTGRYAVTFTGLSAALGGTSTLKVTGYGSNNSYCKPVVAYLVNDKVEVRCYKGGTGTPVNARFTLLVSRAAADRAFAFANQPTDPEYSPDPKGSSNPAGPIKVTKLGMGLYEVVFTNLRSQLSPNFGHLQVNAGGSGKAHCTFGEWGGSPDLIVIVSCYTPAGAPVDSKFSVLYTLPAKHLAYAYADQPSAASYSPPVSLSSNPVGAVISITRSAAGKYTVSWAGADLEILGAGNVQVTAGGNGQCKVTGQGPESAQVQCFAPNGALADGYYSVLLGS